MVFTNMGVYFGFRMFDFGFILNSIINHRERLIEIIQINGSDKFLPYKFINLTAADIKQLFNSIL